MKKNKPAAEAHKSPAQEHEGFAPSIPSVRLRMRAYRLIRKILLGVIFISIINVLFSYFFLTPKMYRINRDNRELIIKYRILQERIRVAQQQADEIRHRDNHV